MGTLHGGVLCDIADAAMGIAFASTLAQEESFTTVELKINFFRPVRQARLAARSGMGVHSKRRGEPIGRESGFHVHGASRPEGIRPVIPLSFSGTDSAQPACQPTGFRVPLENFADARRYWSKILRDVMRPNCLFCHLIGVMGTRTRKRPVYSTRRVQVGSHEVRAVAVRGLSSAPSLLHVQIALFV